MGRVCWGCAVCLPGTQYQVGSGDLSGISGIIASLLRLLTGILGDNGTSIEVSICIGLPGLTAIGNDTEDDWRGCEFERLAGPSLVPRVQVLFATTIGGWPKNCALLLMHPPVSGFGDIGTAMPAPPCIGPRLIGPGNATDDERQGGEGDCPDCLFGPEKPLLAPFVATGGGWPKTCTLLLAHHPPRPGGSNRASQVRMVCLGDAHAPNIPRDEAPPTLPRMAVTEQAPDAIRGETFLAIATLHTIDMLLGGQSTRERHIRMT